MVQISSGGVAAFDHCNIGQLCEFILHDFVKQRRLKALHVKAPTAVLAAGAGVYFFHLPGLWYVTRAS